MYDKDKFRLMFKNLEFKQDKKDADIYIRGKAIFELRDTFIRYYLRDNDQPSDKVSGSDVEELYDKLFEKFKAKIRDNKLDDLFGC